MNGFAVAGARGYHNHCYPRFLSSLACRASRSLPARGPEPAGGWPSGRPLAGYARRSVSADLTRPSGVGTGRVCVEDLGFAEGLGYPGPPNPPC